MSDVITTAAEFVLGQEGWIATARARHVPDRNDECVECPSRWPCAQIAIADRADQMVSAALADRAAPRHPVVGQWKGVSARPATGAQIPTAGACSLGTPAGVRPSS